MSDGSGSRVDSSSTGDAARHLPPEELERRLAGLAAPRDTGTLAAIVVRGGDGLRATPARATLSPEDGLPGDRWSLRPERRTDDQITLMRVDVARLFANGQPLSLFGDNLLVALDLSAENLPPGSRLRVGRAVLEVTPEPHTGCRKFQQRFGAAALRLTADRRFRDLRLRGVHARVVERGEVAVGDPVEVLTRV